MSRIGLDWYPREPAAYLFDVQGLSSKEHAVYSVVIDLLYMYGGEIPNDPKFISGYISDMGAASVRNNLTSLASKVRISLEVTETSIIQKRAKNEAKTKQKQRENAQETGRKGGKKSAELRAERKENNSLGQADPSTKIQPEKRREEKSDDDVEAREAKNGIEILTPREQILIAIGHDKSGTTATGRMVGNPADMLELGRWQDDLGLSLQEVIGVIEGIRAGSNKPPPTVFKYFENPMREFAGRKNAPTLTPQTGGNNGNGNYNGKANHQAAGPKFDAAKDRALRLAGLR